jgi:PHD/YefM family antitoxin component YafN of YafNO toxin-antitoxin module
MKFVNVRELKNKTSAVLRYTEKKGDVIVTSRGTPRVVIHYLKADEIEDYILLNHPEFKQKLKTGYRQIKKGETIDMDSLIKEAEQDLESL